MTDQKHTKELLKTVDHSWSDVGIYDEKDRRIATLSIYDEATEDNQDELEVEQSANAKRLVECWNACAGIDSPLDLRARLDAVTKQRDEAIKLCSDLIAGNAGLKNSRDELREACLAALEWYGLDGDGIGNPVRAQLESALTKTEEDV